MKNKPPNTQWCCGLRHRQEPACNCSAGSHHILTWCDTNALHSCLRARNFDTFIPKKYICSSPVSRCSAVTAELPLVLSGLLKVPKWGARVSGRSLICLLITVWCPLWDLPGVLRGSEWAQSVSGHNGALNADKEQYIFTSCDLIRILMSFVLSLYFFFFLTLAQTTISPQILKYESVMTNIWPGFHT